MHAISKDLKEKFAEENKMKRVCLLLSVVY